MKNKHFESFLLFFFGIIINNFLKAKINLQINFI